MNERLGQSTSSPALISAATKAMCNAVVQEETAIACSAPTYSANRFSNSATFGPWLTHPLRRTSRTAASSSLPINGRATGMFFVIVAVLIVPPWQLRLAPACVSTQSTGAALLQVLLQL